MNRVNGCLAVSRALGDYEFKKRTDLAAEQQQVSAEPEVTGVLPLAHMGVGATGPFAPFRCLNLPPEFVSRLFALCIAPPLQC